MSAEVISLNEKRERAPKSQFDVECIKRRAMIAEWRGRAATVPEWDPGGNSINEAIVACKTDLGITVGALGDVWDDSWNGLSGPQIIGEILNSLEAIGIVKLVESQGFMREEVMPEGSAQATSVEVPVSADLVLAEVISLGERRVRAGEQAGQVAVAETKLVA